jgi:hypothetical protein
VEYAWVFLSEDLVKTQSQPIFDTLNSGVRALDLRFGVKATGVVTLHACHAFVNLDTKVQLIDILGGLAYWLSQNPTETLLVSLKQDNHENTPEVQAEVRKWFQDETLKPYWVQEDNTVSIRKSLGVHD